MRKYTVALIVLFVLAGVCHGGDTVTLRPTPNGGIRPQVVVDGRGVVHMVYAAPNTGERRGGDNLAYIRQEPGQQEFSKPITVNSIPGSVFRLVPTEMAVGPDGRVHVSWAGSMGYVIEQSSTRTRPAKMEDMK